MTTKRAMTIALIANGALIVVAISLGLAKTGNPGRYFGEGRFTMAFSCAQLLLVAFFAARTFLARRKLAPKLGFFSAAWLWALIAAGFVFLAADDGFQIHEHLDVMIHKKFHIHQTSLSDRLDDALIAVYGLIGATVLWVFRRELLKFKRILPPLVAGFACLFISVCFDTISNDEQWLVRFFGDMAVPKQLGGWFSAGDGAFTLLGEGLFVAAFYLVYRAASQPDTVASASSMNSQGISGLNSREQ
jgi:hypothetical protein